MRFFFILFLFIGFLRVDIARANEEDDEFFNRGLNRYEMEDLKNEIDIERMNHGLDSWENEEKNDI